MGLIELVRLAIKYGDEAKEIFEASLELYAQIVAYVDLIRAGEVYIMSEFNLLTAECEKEGVELSAIEAEIEGS